MAVSDMPEAKSFYADELDLKVATDYRRDDHDRWLSLTMNLYLATSAVAAAHELSAKSTNVSEVKDDLSGPGSGVEWFNLEDPDGNRVILVQA